MGIEFTAEQKQVIELRNRNILVSAAAGSGKTAVLVERIITRLTKDKNPINVDELLIVTFTEAAAAEMKERIHRAIEAALEEEPGDEHLQRQATLIHQAQITTIHKFCLSVIRDYFHTIDLDPGFRVGEDGELKLLKQDVVEQVLENAYQENELQFVTFVESFASGRDDSKLDELVLKLYEHSRSYPDPDEWLDNCAKQYDIQSVSDFEEKEFVQETKAEISRILENYIEYLQFGIEICKTDDGPKSYIEAMEDDCEQFRKLIQLSTYTEMQKMMSEFKWMTLKACKDQSVSEDKIEQVKGIRDSIKKKIESIKKDYFFADTETMQKDMQRAKANIGVLTELTKRFARAFSEEKRKKNLIDFNDMEQYALQILTQKENGSFVPSSVAESYQDKYAEVMIDEYQDSNYVQEAILTSVSGVSKGNYNVFMVGDVKQSIYRFRLSRPELFMEKFHTYSLKDSKTQRIDLHKNFRSRREVLDASNFVFEQIMVPEFGGIAYDEKAALYVGADYQEKEGNDTEFILVEIPQEEKDEKIEIEAQVIAKRIKELMENHSVYDRKTGSFRRLEYRDIVILLRGMEGWADTLSKVLNDAGIPTYANSKNGYFETQEIKLVLQYLKILDNPRQDIPFAAILNSFFVGLNDEELAHIRSCSNKKSLYECVCDYAENGQDQKITERLNAFMEQYESFRRQVPHTAIHTLLWKILEETGFGDYAGALPGGEQRTANLETLVEKAVAFEGTSYKGLFNFVRYIEQLQKYKVDYGETNLMDEQNDVVSLMTIHKSKGLEFPIVFVAGMGKEFNMQDARQSVMIHPELGLGVPAIDPIMRTKSNTLMRKVIQKKIENESKAEELRVLYVAMTRAKEKLILVGSCAECEKEISKWLWILQRKETALPYSNLTTAKKYMDWILPALLRNQCATALLAHCNIPAPYQNPLYQKGVPIVTRIITLDQMYEWIEDEIMEEQFTKEILQNWDTNQTYDEDLLHQLEEQFFYQYPYQEGGVTKQKLSVSELKKKAYEEVDEQEVISLLPNFLQEEEKFSGALKGSVYHKILEVLDHTKMFDEDNLKEEFEKIKNQGFLTEDMFACICVKDILGFLKSSVGQRMREAYMKDKCRKEQPFVLGVEAKRIYPNAEQDEVLLVQGIIDVFFEEEDGLVLLDYKTDKVFNEEILIRRYKTQLEYYSEALEKMTGKKVKEQIIYSFAMHKEIKLC